MKKHNYAGTLARKKKLALAIAMATPLILSSQVQAFEFNTGEIEGSFDSQLTLGSSWRVENASSDLIGAGEGLYTDSDDGNRNYQKGDAFSQIFKGSHDLQVSYQNFGGFVRGKYWYDSALKNNSVDYGHAATADVGGLTGTALTYNNNEKLDDSNFNDLSKASGATLLDAFVYGEFEVMDMPLDVRLGKQVVSWGESTFIFGGINAINPVDVNAFTRPGAEIKEGLLPVNMAFASIGLTDNLSAEFFYQLEFQETVLPGCGTYFSTADSMADGCDSILMVNDLLSLGRDEDGVKKPDDDGQYGLAFRYISEALADTEFGLYAMNIHSRAPLLNVSNHALTADMETGIYIQALTDYTNAGGIPGFGSAQEYAGGSVAVARVATGGYFISYPEDMQLMGLSFATNLGSVAVSGEISHQLDAPVQINGNMLLQAVSFGVTASSATDIQNLELAPGDTIDGYREFDISQAQLTAIKLIDQVAGANSVTLIAEAGYTYIHGFDEGSDAIKYGRSDIYGTPGDIGNVDDGFVTQSAWGYRARLMAEYSNVFRGINLQPMLSWSDDVKGYSPATSSRFSEGQQSLGLSLQANYLETYSADISYTQFMGGDYSTIKDRDFAAISLGVQF